MTIYIMLTISKYDQHKSTRKLFEHYYDSVAGKMARNLN